jgi:hypothetical protein
VVGNLKNAVLTRGEVRRLIHDVTGKLALKQIRRGVWLN